MGLVGGECERTPSPGVRPHADDDSHTEVLPSVRDDCYGAVSRRGDAHGERTDEELAPVIGRIGRRSADDQQVGIFRGSGEFGSDVTIAVAGRDRGRRRPRGLFGDPGRVLHCGRQYGVGGRDEHRIRFVESLAPCTLDHVHEFQACSVACSAACGPLEPRTVILHAVDSDHDRADHSVLPQLSKWMR